jgi:hypothetical protein
VRGAVLALIVAWGLEGRAEARELWDGRLQLRTTLKSTLLLSSYARDRTLFPEPGGGQELFRLRHDVVAAPSEELGAGFSWETRASVAAPPGVAASGILPSEAPPSFRIRSIDEPIAINDGFRWRHEVDRAFLVWRPPRTEVTIGRQAIGWGRGVLFGAVDLFAPFSPLEADRAWRRGVDAMRAEVRLGERASVDAAAALGHDGDPEDSIFAARLRGYLGEVDGELLLGWRAADLFAGLTSSADVGGGEVHGELALFRTPAANRDPLLANDRLVAKAVLGASYRLPLGNGLPVFVEYHYSGFGAAPPGDLVALSNPLSPTFDERFTERLLRGDTQLAARQAVALLATYEATETTTFQLLWLVSPRDGSGVVSPGATLSLGDRATVQATAYLPLGSTPTGGVLRSDFGATPLSVLVQLAVYD